MLNTRPVLILVLKFEEDLIIPFLLNYLCFGLFQIWLFIDLGFFMMKFVNHTTKEIFILFNKNLHLTNQHWYIDVSQSMPTYHCKIFILPI